MKKIILISAILIIIVNSNLFAKKGFGGDLTVTLGAGVGFFHGDMNKYPDGSFEFGVYLKPNYYFEFAVLSLGLSLEVGYQRDIFAYKYYKSKGNYSFDSIALGFFPKIDVLFLSIGFGGGIKFPLGGNYSFVDTYGGRRLEKYDYKEMQGRYGKNLFIPYIKAAVDFILLPNIALGVYISYDIPLMNYKIIVDTLSQTKIAKFSSLDIGGQITLRF